MRLTVTRGALGMELYEPIALGPLWVTRLELTLPNLKFPVDLSGGVPAFRHRRGDLERVELRLGLAELAGWLEPRTRDLLGVNGRRPLLWAIAGGVGVGLAAGDRALAFDLIWAPSEGDARLLVMNPRGHGLPGPAMGFALRVVDTVLGQLAERNGRCLALPRAGSRLGRALLPPLGGRAPAGGRVRFGELQAEGDELWVELDAAFAPVASSDEATRAMELAEIAREADDALASNDLDAARAAYVLVLERAPRHPEIARAIAEIDVSVGGRAEAALGLLVESLSATHAGAVGAELLAMVGDLAGASAALDEAVRVEPFAPLAAALLLRKSSLAHDARDRQAALDAAVARAPTVEHVRWARFDARLQGGDVSGALADAQHLEAAASGSSARYQACVRAGDALLGAGFAREAASMFERALRYLPDDSAASTGLARSFITLGRTERAFALLERAIALAERAGHTDPEACLELALLLAQRLHDLPSAIARARQVPASAPRAVEARALEARWRSMLGDIAGASIAWAKLRETIELARPPHPDHARFLVEAARFEREIERDVVAAERYLAIALRLVPRDAEVQRAYRDVAAIVAAARRTRSPELFERSAPDIGSEPPAEAPVPSAAAEAAAPDEGEAEVPPGGAMATWAPDEGESTRYRAEPETVPPDTAAPDTAAPDAAEPDTAEPDEAELEDIAQRMESALRADPGNADAARRLAVALEGLGRDQELFALLSARLEDAEPEERPELLPATLRVLERLERDAQRPEDARLFADLRARFERE